MPGKIEDEEKKAVINSSKEKFKKLMVVLQYWRILGREALYFKQLVEGTEYENIGPRCENCKTNENLTVKNPKF